MNEFNLKKGWIQFGCLNGSRFSFLQWKPTDFRELHRTFPHLSRDKLRNTFVYEIEHFCVFAKSVRLVKSQDYEERELETLSDLAGGFPLRLKSMEV